LGVPQHGSEDGSGCNIFSSILSVMSYAIYAMGFRFQKRIRILPGVRVNLGKRGASVSIGGKGVTANVSTRGVQNTYSIPGTGLSYVTKREGAGCMIMILGLLGMIAALKGILA
jgi:hypothetical protein